jgi:cell division protein FtsW (lipid II flippase)
MAYYKWSPGVASLISTHGIFKALVRMGLLPFIGLSFLFLHFGPIGAGIGLVVTFGLPSIFIWRRKRKKRRVKKHD